MGKVKELLKNKKIVALGAVGIAIIGAFIIFSGASKPAPAAFNDPNLGGLSAVYPTGPSDSGVGQGLLATLAKLRSLNLDAAFFSSRSLTNLKDLTVAIAPQPVGRRNPFMSPGADEKGVSSGSGGSKGSKAQSGGAPVKKETSGPRLASLSEAKKFDQLFALYVAARQKKDVDTLVNTFGYLKEQAKSFPDESIWSYKSYTIYKAVVKSEDANHKTVEAFYNLPYSEGTTTRLLLVVNGSYNLDSLTGFMYDWMIYPSTDNPRIYAGDAEMKAAADGIIQNLAPKAGQ